MEIDDASEGSAAPASGCDWALLSPGKAKKRENESLLIFGPSHAMKSSGDAWSSGSTGAVLDCGAANLHQGISPPCQQCLYANQKRIAPGSDGHSVVPVI